MTKKIERRGLNFNLEPAQKRNPDGIHVLLNEMHGGSARVTRSKKTSTNCNGHRYRCSPNIPPSLNGSHSLFLVDYKIHVEHIYNK